ncbi:MAG: hypothetical protein J5875_12605 [Paludibacteraceae bacterium]|nr:hypothetical protein [Paludibacteraceae bacterium]
MIITAILTGDIVGSSKIEHRFRPKLNETLYKVVDDFKVLSSDVRIEMYRGDGFQVEVKNPEQAIKLAILLRAGLRAATPLSGSKQPWDARVSVGLGGVSYMTDSLITSDGEAFVNSGHGLDCIGKKKISIKTPWSEVDENISLLTEFVDDIISNWTIQQSIVIYKKILTNKSQREIAEERKQKPANISSILRKSKELLISKYINRYESLIKEKTLAI